MLMICDVLLFILEYTVGLDLEDLPCLLIHIDAAVVSLSEVFVLLFELYLLWGWRIVFEVESGVVDNCKNYWDNEEPIACDYTRN